MYGIFFLPALGARHTDGVPYSLNSSGFYWSSTQVDSTRGYALDFRFDTVTVVSHARAAGFSVRCVR